MAGKLKGKDKIVAKLRQAKGKIELALSPLLREDHYQNSKREREREVAGGLAVNLTYGHQIVH